MSDLYVAKMIVYQPVNSRKNGKFEGFYPYEGVIEYEIVELPNKDRRYKNKNELVYHKVCKNLKETKARLCKEVLDELKHSKKYQPFGVPQVHVHYPQHKDSTPWSQSILD